MLGLVPSQSKPGPRFLLGVPTELGYRQAGVPEVAVSVEFVFWCVVLARFALPLLREVGRRRGACGVGPFPSSSSRTGRAGFLAPRSPVTISGRAWWPALRGCPRGS